MSLLLDCRPVRAPLSGVARYCIGLSNALAQGLALELDLLVQTDGRDFQYVNHLPDGLKKVQGRYLSRFPFIQNGLLEYCPSLGRIMFGSGYRVTHETYFANMGSWRRAQKIATIHDVIPLERPELFSDRLVKYSLRNFFRQVEEADLLISVSEYTREKIIEYAPLADSKIIVIGNGVDESILSRSESNAFQEDALLRGLSYFAFVGNIEPRKNLLTLAKAFDAAFPAPSQKKLVIAGRKNHQGDLIINQLHHVLGERLIYLGPVSEERKWRILSNAEGLVMPSEYEGFGIPIYEGYAVGTPVLIADNSSMSELAARDEQLFDTFNVDQLRNALIEVAESSDWVQPAVRKGRSIVSSATWQKIAEKTKLVYKQLM